MNKITQAVSMQVYIMFILVVVGYVLTKKNFISRKGSADISNILLTIVTPSVLIRSYQMDINKDLLFTLGIAFVDALPILRSRNSNDTLGNIFIFRNWSCIKQINSCRYRSYIFYHFSFPPLFLIFFLR